MAARAGTDFKYAGSDELDAVGWFDDNSGEKTRPVGQKAPNGWGLYDLSGNVWEWCWDATDIASGRLEDCKLQPYSSGTVTDPTGHPYQSGARRAFRGGCWNEDSWHNSEVDPWYARVAYRGHTVPSDRFGLGIRLTRTLP